MRRNPPRPSSDSCRCGSPSVRAIQERITAGISRRTFLGGAAAMLATPLLGGWPGRAWAQQPGAPERPILLTNLRLFDGTSPTVRRGVQILVEGNRIHALPAAGRAVEGAEVIDCGGWLVMPGLIDEDWHATLCGITRAVRAQGPLGVPGEQARQ